MGAFLQIESLALQVGRFRLGPLSLAVDEREYFVLLGPTGCGKSTLLRLIAGALRPGAGHIRLDGRDLTRLPPERRGVAYVSQAGDLFPHLTVAGNIAFGLRFQRLTAAERQARVDRMLEVFGLRPLAGQRAATVSGGEGRKVAMARSLAVGPRLLLLDEPLGMLDPNARRAMLGVLERIHTELRTTTIHVSHDRPEAWDIADRCGVMLEGDLAQTGRVEEVFRRPRTRRVAEFTGAENILPAGALGAAGPAAAPFVLRPEWIRVSADPAAPAHARGTLTALRDRGDHLLLDIRLDGGVNLTAYAPPAAAATLAPGAAVACAWPDGAPWALAPEPDRPAAGGGTP